MKRKLWLVGSVAVALAVISGACGPKKNDGTGGGTGGSDASGGVGPDGSGGKHATGGSGGTGGMDGFGGGGAGNLGGMDMGGMNMGGYATTEHQVCDEIEAQGTGADANFMISSSEFEDCDPMPLARSCDGHAFATGSSPALAWSGAPTGTLSFALVFKDISIEADGDDATANFAYHSVIWDIPADVNNLPANLSDGALSPDVPGARQWAGRNDYGFFPPCPNPFPVGHPAFSGELVMDSYAFTLYALDVAVLTDLPVQDETQGKNWVRTMDAYLKTKAIAVTEYRGTSDAWAKEGPAAPPDLEYPCTTGVTTGCQPAPVL